MYDNDRKRFNVPAISQASPILGDAVGRTSDTIFDLDADPYNTHDFLGASAVMPGFMSQDVIAANSRSTNNRARDMNMLPQLQSYLTGISLHSRIAPRLEIGTLARLRARDPVGQRTSNLVLQTLRTFPEKMLNQDDLPFFIHAHKHGDALPEPLAVCVRISHLFATRTPDILPFIFRSIRNEQYRFLQEVSQWKTLP